MRNRPSFIFILALSALTIVTTAGCSSGSSTDSATETPTSANASATPSTSLSSTRAATLPPQPGSVVAREDFGDARNHRFGTESNAAATSSVSGGKYRMVLKRSGLPHGQLVDVASAPSAVSIAFDTSTTTGATEAWMGPLCFFQQRFGFSLRVHPDGRYELVQISVQGEDIATLESGTVAPITPGTAVRMRLDCEWALQEATATGWIGATQVGPAADVEPSDNVLRVWAGEGFWAMSPTVPATVVIDNVVLTQKD